jgi:hypothetical protein
MGNFSMEKLPIAKGTRTPALVRVPFAMGNFSMEWVR